MSQQKFDRYQYYDGAQSAALGALAGPVYFNK
jgi:hypothetical protein